MDVNTPESSSKVTLRTYTRKRPLVAILATPGDGSTACLRNDIKVLSSLGDINQLNRPLDRTLPIGRADGVLRVYKKKPRLSTGEQAIRVPSSNIEDTRVSTSNGSHQLQFKQEPNKRGPSSPTIATVNLSPQEFRFKPIIVPKLGQSLVYPINTTPDRVRILRTYSKERPVTGAFQLNQSLSPLPCVKGLSSGNTALKTYQRKRKTPCYRAPTGFSNQSSDNDQSRTSRTSNKPHSESQLTTGKERHETKISRLRITTTDVPSSVCSHKERIFFTPEELASLDEAGINGAVPRPEQIEDIMTTFREALHCETVTCAVCDQMCPVSSGSYKTIANLPVSLFHLLQAPKHSDTGPKELHPALVSQYNVSTLLENDSRFHGILLSPRGVQSHTATCANPTSCNCVPRLFICENFGCEKALRRGTMPKCAIANGNWIGIVPKELQDMTYGTLALLRPVQSFGRIASFQWNKHSAGSTLKGHLYAAKLSTPLVRDRLPLHPNDAPVRVIVASPFATDKAAYALAKIAAAKADYAIEKDKIEGMLKFWSAVNNRIIADVNMDAEALKALSNLAQDPDGSRYFEGMFLHVDTRESSGNATDETNRRQDEETTGGPSLLRSNSEMETTVFTSATITIGGTDVNEKNAHEQVADALCSEPLRRQGETQTFVVRPTQQFVSDDDPDYAEKHYPVKFAFGRGGFGEIRTKPMSKEAILKRLLNLSQRQFQEVDFVLPCCDLINKSAMKRQAFVRAKLPSFHINADGTRKTKGEAFGQVSMADMHMAGEYKKKCAQAAKLGIRHPTPPSSMNGLSMEFFRDLSIATSPMQHSRAAASINRQNIYAAHNNNGKAQIWFTFSPDDTQSLKIMWYALGEDACKNHKFSAPSGTFRFNLVAKRPVAAALHFQHVMDLVIEHILGWDEKTQKPFRCGGIFGDTKAWLFVVEEQGRLTLHGHGLVWLHGHSDIAGQFNHAFKETNSQSNVTPKSESELNRTSDMDIPNSTTSQSNAQSDSQHSCALDHAYAAPPTHPKPADTPMERLTSSFTEYIDCLSSAELDLPDEEMAVLLHCENGNCSGEIDIKSRADLEGLRKRAPCGAEEPAVLHCTQCKATYTITSRLSAALDHGFKRCFGRQRLSDEEVVDIKWAGLPAKPNENDAMEYARWQLKFASVQLAVNLHDWKHRTSCFKKSNDRCRYHLPQGAVRVTSIIPVLSKNNQDPENSSDLTTDSVEGVAIQLRRRPPFALMTECNLPFMWVLNYNNCTRYVSDQKVSMYLASYVTKHSTENEQELAEVLRLLHCYMEKIAAQEAIASQAIHNESRDINEPALSSSRAAINSETNGEPKVKGTLDEDQVPDKGQSFRNVRAPRSDASIGLGRLMAGIHASTSGETIGAPMAAYTLLGGKIFRMSHDTAVLPLNQALAFLKREELYASLSRGGTVYASIYDYVYRNNTDPRIERMNYWEFTATQQLCPLSKHNQNEPSTAGFTEARNPGGPTANFTEDDSLSESDEEPAPKRCNTEPHPHKHSTKQFRFSNEHPLSKTHGHRERKRVHWTRYSGKRLPDLMDLSDESGIPVEERQEKREFYAQAVLIMFWPFRVLQDLLEENESWWDAYLRRRPVLLEETKTRHILQNIQDFYESFCRASVNEPQEEQMDQDLVSDMVADAGSEDEGNDAPELAIDIDGELSATPDSADNVCEFVKMLTVSDNNPLLVSLGSKVTVQKGDADIAISEIPERRTRDYFTLPGRASVSGDIPGILSGTHERLMQSNLDTSKAPLRVDLMENLAAALRDVTFPQSNDPSQLPNQLPTPFPSLRQHSSAWGLDEEQHAAFVLCGTALLQHVASSNALDPAIHGDRADHITSEIHESFGRLLNPSQQLILYLGGSAGTGKSRVISALSAFAEQWQSIASVVISATTGIAAVQIGGCTLHCALGLQLDMHPSQPSPSQMEAWSEVGLLLIDECSMLKQDFFALANDRLRKLKGRMDRPFGGLHVILCGDFFQLPPVGGAPLYATPRQSHRSPSNASYLAEVQGHHLWQTCLTDVIELKKNHRQSDPIWAASLLRWRINQPTKEDIEMVNSRYMKAPETINNTVSDPPPISLAVVPTNNEREAGLRFYETRFLRQLQVVHPENHDWRTRGVLLIQADVCLGRKKGNMTEADQEKIRNASNKRLDVVGNLLCFIGAAYLVNTNAAVSKGVANGTLATLHDVVLKEGVEIRVVNTSGSTPVHAVYARDVRCLVFKHSLGNWAQQSLFRTLPTGCFPILPQKHFPRFKFDGQITTVNVIQFACVLALVLTGHKVQGQSLRSIILGATSKQYVKGAHGWLYVILSRVRTLLGLCTFIRLPSDPRSYKPRTDVVNEMKRLLVIETATLARLQSHMHARST